jgi:hypothetical protein
MTLFYTIIQHCHASFSADGKGCNIMLCDGIHCLLAVSGRVGGKLTAPSLTDWLVDYYKNNIRIRILNLYICCDPVKEDSITPKSYLTHSNDHKRVHSDFYCYTRSF